MAAVTAFLLNLGWPLFVRLTAPALVHWAGAAEIALAASFLAAYAWFAYAATVAAARRRPVANARPGLAAGRAPPLAPSPAPDLDPPAGLGFEPQVHPRRRAACDDSGTDVRGRMKRVT
jgi:hypothetical protein